QFSGQTLGSTLLGAYDQIGKSREALSRLGRARMTLSWPLRFWMRPTVIRMGPFPQRARKAAIRPGSGACKCAAVKPGCTTAVLARGPPKVRTRFSVKWELARLRRALRMMRLSTVFPRGIAAARKYPRHGN